ncbi:hypothetical protein ZHAS_00013036 [Anopheles sinensis]|uniref:Uncharacterized protein n=1 Tax=Anopheles sinensis TaxID=74873 RepID=A0A084W4H1_ANOSI|nr:hypothetical protein ZHAS_00013036 [Anopheles sinensis]
MRAREPKICPKNLRAARHRFKVDKVTTRHQILIGAYSRSASGAPVLKLESEPPRFGWETFKATASDSVSISFRPSQLRRSYRVTVATTDKSRVRPSK